MNPHTYHLKYEDSLIFLYYSRGRSAPQNSRGRSDGDRAHLRWSTAEQNTE